MENKNYESFDNEILEKLKNKTCFGIPSNIIILSEHICNKWCHWMSVILSSAMDDFTLVRGNINIFNSNDINHSWIEKDDYVYDTTFGLKFKKDFYYKKYNAKQIEVLSKEDCQKDDFYQNFLKLSNKNIIHDEEIIELLFIKLKYLEKIKPTINGTKLLESINEYQEKRKEDIKIHDSIIKEYLNDIKKEYKY